MCNASRPIVSIAYMANKNGWFALRGVSVAAAKSSLLAIAEHAPEDAIPEHGFGVRRRGAWATVMIRGWAFGHVFDWTRMTSMWSGCAAVGFFILEGSWNYVVYDRGVLLAGMQHYPYPLPRLRGDLQSAARALGVEPQLFSRYHEMVRAACRLSDTDADDLRSLFAFPGDEFAGDDDWVHVDFAKRLGIEYPGPSTALPLVPSSPATPRPTQWATTRKRLGQANLLRGDRGRTPQMLRTAR